MYVKSRDVLTWLGDYIYGPLMAAPTILSSTMAHTPVDDSAHFRRMMTVNYKEYDQFFEQFREYQLRTCTSFYIYNSRTREAWAKEHDGREMPEGLPYYFVKFCCVHRKRKSGGGNK